MCYHPISDQDILKVLANLADQDNFVFLETSKTDSENHYSYLFTRSIDQLVLRNHGKIEDFFSRAESYLEQGYYLAGWAAYELGHSLEPSLEPIRNQSGSQILCQFGVFPPPIIFDHKKGEFNSHLACLAKNSSSNKAAPIFTIGNICPNQSQEEYLDKIQRVKRYIKEGDTYQVNYTMKLLFDFHGSPTLLYETLRRSQSVAYGALLKFGETFTLSFSPELFLRKKGTQCTVRPMKGTAARGRTLEEDQALADRFQRDDKNRSENVMIVDLLRNDLGRLATTGSVDTVSLFNIETYRTLHQMTSTINATIEKSVGLQQLFKAMFPCGSVTGAPKIRTMEIIHELEREPRGVYTGAIGFISPQRDMVFNVPIRTITLQGNRGEMGIGSGIIDDSDPENEWQECLLKGRFLTERVPDFQLIETILWTRESGFWLSERHLKRVADSAQYFQFPPNTEKIKTHLSQLSERFSSLKTPQPPDKPGIKVRLLIHKNGRIETTITPCTLPANSQFPPENGENESPLRVKLSLTKTNQNSPYLYHKTTLRELYNEERESALREGFGEVIFQNEKDEITEGSISTIFIKKRGMYFTPPISSGLLPGTFREHLLANFPDQIKEKTLFVEDLHDADTIYLANSVRGLVKHILAKADNKPATIGKCSGSTSS